MKKLTVEELKQIQLHILDCVDAHCKKNHIKYWLDYGSLLGAVRHKGYIPWDDDIDIGMLREDYVRFVETFPAEHGRYQLYCPETRQDWYYPYGKVVDTRTVLYEPDEKGMKLCVNIDLFVYDQVSADRRALQKIYSRIHRYSLLNMLQHNMISDKGLWYRRAAMRLLGGALRVFPDKYFLDKILAVMKQHEGLDTGIIGCLGWWDYLAVPIEVVSDTVDILFEGKAYCAPRDYGTWLTHAYQDYMELPPEEERVSHHRFEAYLCDAPSDGPQAQQNGL